MDYEKIQSLIQLGRENLNTRRQIPLADRAFLMREAATSERIMDALEEAMEEVKRYEFHTRFDGE